MKKIILTILLILAIWSCEKKESPIIDNTKDLYKKIDSLTILRSRIDTVLKIQKVEKIKIVERIKIMKPKEVDSTLFFRYNDSMTDSVKKQIAIDLSELDCVKEENKSLYQIIEIEENKNLVKDIVIFKKDSLLGEKDVIIIDLKKQVVKEENKKSFWKISTIIPTLLLIFK